MPLIHVATLTALDNGDNRACAFRPTLALEGDKAWITTTPSASLRTLIPNRTFRLWLKFYCLCHSFPATKCPRPNCKKTTDVYGDHSLICPHKSLVGRAPMNERNDKQVRLIARLLRRLNRGTIIEPRNKDQEATTRVDIRALSDKEGQYLIYISMVSAMTSLRTVNKRLGNHLTLIQPAFDGKIKKHRPLAKLHTNAGIMPIISYTTGLCEPRSHQFLTSITYELGAQSNSDPATTKTMFFQRLVISTIANDSDMLHQDKNAE